MLIQLNLLYLPKIYDQSRKSLTFYIFDGGLRISMFMQDILVYIKCFSIGSRSPLSLTPLFSGQLEINLGVYNYI